MTLEYFATMVKRIAAESLNPFGRKAWIHRVYTLFYVETGRTVDFADFKSMLWAAHHDKLISLSRCDMVEAFSATDVRRSTMNVMGGSAQFNFINF